MDVLNSRKKIVAKIIQPAMKPGRSNGSRMRRKVVMKLAPKPVSFAPGVHPTAVVDAWMGSPGHRANLLRGSFREAGVAVMYNPAAGGVFGGEATWVVTLDLGRR